jgi:ketosteroid isomerase-like protein
VIYSYSAESPERQRGPVWAGSTPRGSGVRVEAPLGAVFEFRDGKISRMRAFLDQGEALRAAGLSE